MKSTLRLPLAIAMTSALAFAAGCDDNRNVEDRTAMDPATDAPAMTTPQAQTPPMDPVPANDGAYTADAGDSQQPMDDTWITTKVKSSLLADSDVSGLDINVETVNGVVTLTGQVDQQAQIEHAANIARGIEGVTDVRTTELVSR
jgi:hyperosmotically inducible protein